jgi:hypothetical protein
VQSHRVSRPGRARWLVDVEHPDSISAIEGAIGPLLASFNVTHLTTVCT